MSVKKTSLVLHLDALAVIEELNLEQRGLLLTAIYNYHTGEKTDLDQLLKIVFLPFKNQFDRDREKYKKTCETNREIAQNRVRKSGAKKEEENNESLPELTNRNEPSKSEPKPNETTPEITEPVLPLPETTYKESDNKKGTDKKIKPEKQKELDTVFFLELFNRLKKEKKPLSTGTKTLTSTSKANLKKLVESGYKAPDFEAAINEMLNSKWVADTGNDTPEHVLRENNFQRYHNKAQGASGGFKKSENNDVEFIE